MFADVFNNAVENNKHLIMGKFKEELESVVSNWDTQLSFISAYIGVSKNVTYAIEDEYTIMIFSSLYKNCYSLYSAIELTKMGLYGSARIIFRNVFESLIIAKTIAIKNDHELLEKWEEGENISLRKDVFRGVKKPNSQAMQEFWKMLNEFTHGTIYSQQVALDYEDIKGEIRFNLVCIKMLLDMNYHVLNTYAANRSIKYYTKVYMDIGEGTGIFQQKREGVRQEIKNFRKTLLKEPKSVVLDFCSRWEFK